MNDLVKQFDRMAPMMKEMAGKGMGGRMQAVQDLQKSGMLNPGGTDGQSSKGTPASG